MQRPKSKIPNTKNNIQLTCLIKADAYDKLKADSASSGIPVGIIVSKLVLGVDEFERK